MSKEVKRQKILVACEESQAVTIELRKLGHEAYSCDIMECSGGHPEWHIKGDVLPILNPYQGGHLYTSSQNNTCIDLPHRWDMIIAFPPCTHLSVSGARHFEGKRKDGRQREAIEFFMAIVNADCEKIVIENPVNIIGGDYIKKWFPDLIKKYNFKKSNQRIQPYEYGDPFTKTTCLWLKNLPKLIPTNIVDKGERTVFASGKSHPKWYADALKLKPNERSKARSKTFPGIAKAMAEQWAGKVGI